MSEPVTAIDPDAVLFAVFGSLLALVVPDTVAVPTAVGVPLTVQVIAAPGAMVAGGTGEHVVVRPAGRPLTAQVAAVAATAGAAALVHVKVPE